MHFIYISVTYFYIRLFSGMCIRKIFYAPDVSQPKKGPDKKTYPKIFLKGY